jgi:hypothetical protein
MERFSNEYVNLIKQVKKELSTLDMYKTEDCLFMYSETPSFSAGHFSLFLIDDKPTGERKLFKKTWDNEYDLNRFSSGIYNLDRLCIKTRGIAFSSNQQIEYERILNNIRFIPEDLEAKGYLLLDGTQYELGIRIKNTFKKYEWKLATKEFDYFKPLIEFLTTVAQ